MESRRLSPLIADLPRELAADDQLARRADCAERAPGHAELAVVRVCDRRHLEPIVNVAEGRVYLQGDRFSSGVQLPVDFEVVAVERGTVGDELDLRVPLDIEEVG